MEPKLRIVTWEKLVDDTVALAGRLSGEKFDIIVAIARGGLVVARLLSDLLGVKKVASLQIEYYRGVDERKKAPRVIGELGISVRGLNVLVVDDVADTGETLKLAVNYLREREAKRVVTCTPYVKPWCKFKPDYYAEIVEEWIVFPYEHAETARYLLEKGWSYEKIVSEGLRSTILSLVLELGSESIKAGERRAEDGG